MKRLVVVVFDGTPLGIMSFAFGVFDLAKHYGALPGTDVRVVAGEPGAALGLAPSVAFDLVIPSLPGFAFSAPLQDRGWSTRRTAAAWAALLRRLGYPRYGAAGTTPGR